MTLTERQLNMRRWGYQPLAAEFLVYAALGSGYFVRRQFDALHRSGSRTARFLERLERRSHVKVLSAGRRRNIYHLSYAPMYQWLGDTSSRNRRAHSLPSIRSRIMGLDYILEKRGTAEPILTEADQVAHFVNHGATLDDLPYTVVGSRRRYFTDNFPILLNADGSVEFTYIDSGSALRNFEVWLERHARVFGKVTRFSVVCVSTMADMEPFFRKRFDAAIVAARPGDFDDRTRGLLDYFSAKNDIDQGVNLRAYRLDKLDWYRTVQAQFAGPEVDALYEQWRQSGPVALGARSSVSFRLQELPYDYDQLGVRVGGDKRTTTGGVTETLPREGEEVNEADSYAEVSGSLSGW